VVRQSVPYRFLLPVHDKHSSCVIMQVTHGELHFLHEEPIDTYPVAQFDKQVFVSNE
jgi:hypothetical protein